MPKIEFNYSQIAEKIYSRSFNAICIFNIIYLLIIRSHKAPEKSDYDFYDLLQLLIKFDAGIFILFVIPVSIQIVGNQLPVIKEIIKELKNNKDVKK
jgi:hypothetical protein